MTANRTAGKGGKNGRAKDDDLLGPTTEIGRKLKQLYDDVASEAVPERFNDLLAELERREKAEPGKNAE